MASLDTPRYTEAFLREYSGSILITVAAVFAALECAIVSLRFYARRITRAAIGADDYLILITLVLGLAVCSNAIAMVKVAHVGTHIAEISTWPDGAEVIVRWAKFVTSFEILYVSVIMTAKLSVCFFYLRIFVGRWFRTCVYSLMAIQAAWVVAILVTSLLSCRPIQKQWYSQTEGYCINRNAYYRYMSLPNIVTDVILLVLPLPMVWRLQVLLSQRLALMSLFLMGFIGLIASCIRFSIFFQTEAFGDPTWASVNLITWTVVEPGVIIIAACLPLLRPVVVRILPGSSLRKSHSSRKSSEQADQLGGSIITAKHLRRKLHLGFNRVADGQERRHGGERYREEKSGDEETGMGFGRSRGQDLMPLNAIVVRHDVRWDSGT